MRHDQIAQGVGPEERRVSRQDEDVVGPAFECRARAPDRIPSSERLSLNRDLEAVERTGGRR